MFRHQTPPDRFATGGDLVGLETAMGFERRGLLDNAAMSYLQMLPAFAELSRTTPSARVEIATCYFGLARCARQIASGFPHIATYDAALDEVADDILFDPLSRRMVRSSADQFSGPSARNRRDTERLRAKNTKRFRTPEGRQKIIADSVPADRAALGLAVRHFLPPEVTQQMAIEGTKPPLQEPVDAIYEWPEPL